MLYIPLIGLEGGMSGAPLDGPELGMVGLYCGS